MLWVQYYWLSYDIMNIKIYPLSDIYALIPSEFNEVISAVYSEESICNSKLSETINLHFAEIILIAFLDSKPVGRAVLYQNPFHLIDEKKAISIGYLEIIEDNNVWKKFQLEIENEAKKLGGNIIIGPLNGSTWENYRLSDYSQNPLFFTEPFYPEYYHNYFQDAQFSTLANYISNIDRKMDWKNEKILKKEQEFRKFIDFRSLNADDLENDLKLIFPMISDSFENNFLYSPIDQKEFVAKYSKLKALMFEGLVMVAQDKETKEIAGIILALPDMYNKKEKGFLIKTLARNNKYKYAGIGSVLTNIVLKNAQENEYQYCIHAFMISSNTSTAISKSFTGENYKSHTLYHKEIVNE